MNRGDIEGKSAEDTKPQGYSVLRFGGEPDAVANAKNIVQMKIAEVPRWNSPWRRLNTGPRSICFIGVCRFPLLSMDCFLIFLVVSC